MAAHWERASQQRDKKEEMEMAQIYPEEGQKKPNQNGAPLDFPRYKKIGRPAHTWRKEVEKEMDLSWIDP